MNRSMTEQQLLRLNLGFSAAFLAIQYLQLHLEEHRETITPQTVLALATLLESDKYNHKKQAYFLYKAAADSLVFLCLDIQHPLASEAIRNLRQVLLDSTGARQRAVSEALGNLPVRLEKPALTFEAPKESDIEQISLTLFLQNLSSTGLENAFWQGRTLICPTRSEKIICIKFARTHEDIAALNTEGLWLRYLSKHGGELGKNFMIPELICVNTSIVLTITDLPETVTLPESLARPAKAIVFVAEPSYFAYPNHPELFSGSDQDLSDTFKNNARLSGLLAAKGIIHTALIPLFHNRVQQERREDSGLYLWELGGRLDQWLASSAFPNFARSGLRDFEHFTWLESSKKLRHYIGEHILSFTLVLGSCFRNRDIGLKGHDSGGKPVDARCLFDPDRFENIFKTVLGQYYEQLTGAPSTGILEQILDPNLPGQLIYAMGVDEFMEEILRVRDQEEMSDEAFRDFLIQRGQDPYEVAKINRTQADIVLNTGPHLGGFSRQISVPELISLLFRLSALCICDRYIRENGLKAAPNCDI